MFTVDYNSQNPEANILVKQQDIFQNTLTIKSVHCYYCTISCYEYNSEYTDKYGQERTSSERGLSYGSVCISPHGDVPLDVVYKSTPQGEKTFITLWGDSDTKRLIFNIDGKSNINLICQEELFEYFSSGEWASEAYDTEIGKQRWNEERQRYYQQRGSGNWRIYFEITKEQLQKLCSATKLMVQTSNEEGSVQFEGDASGLITILQVLFNEAFDNTMYTAAKDNALSLLESEAANIQTKNDIETSKKKNFYEGQSALIVIIIIFFIIIMIVSLYQLFNL